MHGKNGEPIIIELPVGSLVTNTETGESYEFLTDSEEVVMLRGGNGGYGNEHFKSSTHQNPFDSRPGQSGQTGTFRIELRIIADAGLVGLPNAGKSSLLNALTAARAKIGDYPFTTLEPNLGVLYGYVLADIPGLIEGAAEGKGLGDEFLRHIARTHVLIHCVAADTEDPILAYTTVRNELAAHDPALASKPELIFITKTDTISATRVDEIKAVLSPKNSNIQTVTTLDDQAVKSASDAVVQFIKDSV
jgi:GTP-binding protein